MFSKAQPRTSPTIKSMALMNKRNLHNWEIRLGFTQLAILLLIVTGSMACTFYFGYSAGRDIGYDQALEQTLATTPRLPIDDTARANLNSSTEGSFAALTEHEGSVAGKLEDQNIAHQDSFPIRDRGTNNANLGEEIATESGTNSAKEPAKTALNNNKSGLAADSVFGTDSKLETNTVTDSSAKLSGLVEDSHGKSVLKSKETEAKVFVDKVTNNENATAKAKEPKLTIVNEINAQIEPAKINAKTISADKSETIKVKSALASGWYVQISAQKDIGEAKAQAAKILSSGFPVTIEKAHVKGQDFYRVMVGPEQNKAQVERLQQQVKREHNLKSSPFVRNVK